MGRLADLSGISFKVLNTSKGLAVQGPRAQIDRDIYKKNMFDTLDGKNARIQSEDIVKNLDIVEASVHSLFIEDNICKGIFIKEGNSDQLVKMISKSVILTTGTFLGGRINIGKETKEAGRLMRT